MFGGGGRWAAVLLVVAAGVVAQDENEPAVETQENLTTVSRQTTDPCGGVCHGSRQCVAISGLPPYCVDCRGLLKPQPLGSPYAECCRYNANIKRCYPGLNDTRPPGSCKRNDDLFVRDPKLSGSGNVCTEVTPSRTFSAAGGNACYNPGEFHRNGLACQVRFTSTGKIRCWNRDGTLDRPPCPPASYRFGRRGQELAGDAAGDRSGLSVSISANGKRLAIYTPTDNGLGSRPGYVRIKEFVTGRGWVQLGNDIVIHTRVRIGNTSRAVSLSADGSIVAVGQPSPVDSGGVLTGRVQVYNFRGSQGWVPLGQELVGVMTTDEFGHALALSANGRRLAVSAYRLNTAVGRNAGLVRVYQLQSNGQWGQLGGDIDGDEDQERLGFSVAMSSDGSRIVVSAPLADNNGENSGSVQVFAFTAGVGWRRVGQEIVGDSVEDRNAICDISADGTRVIVGASQFASGRAGLARIYQLNESGSRWVQLGQDINGEKTEDAAYFSLSMSADGNRVAIGAPFNDGTRFQGGHVRIYELQENATWAQLGGDIDGQRSRAWSGYSVALSDNGRFVAIGAPAAEIAAEPNGHVNVFEINSPTCAPYY